jgi:hypothetical protein
MYRMECINRSGEKFRFEEGDHQVNKEGNGNNAHESIKREHVTILSVYYREWPESL